LPTPPPTLHRRFDSYWWARRGVLILAVLIVLVFGTESILALLRRRDVIINVSVQSVAVTTTPTVTPVSGVPSSPTATATPGAALLILLPSDRVIVNVRWNYHIGPRFPDTVVHASAVIDGRDVADGQVNINCGAAALDCTGQQSMTLAYTVPDTGNGSGSQTVDWPAGDYTVIVDRSDGGLKATPIGSYPFRVHS
ncbi:MAG: hypothetical protein ACYDBJ_13185, partial [Aggregatilineales bacterium]